MVDVDNIEIDYINAWKEQGVVNPIKRLAFLHLLCVTKMDEKDSFNYSDWLFFLTKRNLDRAKELYQYDRTQYSIIPICIPSPSKHLFQHRKRAVAFYGTLSYEANHRAIVQFLNEVWLPFFSDQTNLELIVAGKNPREELKNIISKIDNAILYPGFKSLPDILPLRTLAIAPMSEGAGMKTKVAEALSLGMLVAGTQEAFVGYESLPITGLNCENTETSGIFYVDSIQGWKEVIQSYLGMLDEEIDGLAEQNIELFHKYYSIDTSNILINDAFYNSASK